MVLFFGPPGSGKSAQGELLIKRNGWQWLSTGQLLRQSSDQEVLKRMATGELIDDKLTAEVLRDALIKIDKKTTVVLDGYPRNTQQAEWLEKYLAEHGSKTECIIQLNVPKKELLRRLSGRGRAEDSLEVIEKRIEIYNERTEPVIDFYRRHQVPICKINGRGDIKVVHERIQRAIEACSLV